jgi:asparaginyl-tRNA synthetase
MSDILAKCQYSVRMLLLHVCLMVGVMQTSSVSKISVPGPIEHLSEEELVRKHEIARINTRTLLYLTETLTERGFEWLSPVVLSRCTDPLWPDPGASIEKRVETEIYGENVRATQSMIIHKLVACSILHPKLFIISPNVRIEKRERQGTGWHAYEFTQLDFEIRGAEFDDVRKLVEALLSGLVACLKKSFESELSFLRGSEDLAVPSAPFQVFDRDHLSTRYGSGWEKILISEIDAPVWIRNIPREFYDYEDSGIWDNYDLLVPKYGEILSGARREWEFEKISGKMARDGVRKENYDFLLKLAREGRLKPSAGAGIGLERLVGWLVGTSHIGEVQTYPKIPGIVYDL